MKFKELSIGQRFELDGAVYVKTSPVLASPEIGGAAKFIARYVMVSPLGGEQRPAAAREQSTIPAAMVYEALDHHHAACRQALTSLEGKSPSAQLEALFDALETARENFLVAIAREMPEPD